LRRRYQKKRPGCDLDEFRHLMAASAGLIPEEPRRLLLAGGLVGWRLGDFANLRSGSVDLAYTLKGEAAPCMRVRPEDEKTSARKVAFLTGPMLADMQGLLASRRVRRLASAPVFTQPNGSTWHDPKRINAWLRKVLKEVPDDQIPAWKKWGDDAYLPFTFHSLRYTCRTIMVQLGISEHVIDAQLGHKSRYYTSMASHYTTVPESELLRAARSMAAAFANRPAAVAPSVAP